MSRIKEIFHEERPRERCLEHGPECLSLREILAIIIGTGPRGKGCLGLAEDLIARGVDEHQFFNHLEIDGSLLMNDLKGLGAASRARLMALFDFARRYSSHRQNAKATNSSAISQSKLKRAALKKISKNLSEARKEWIGFVPVYISGDLGDFCLVEKGVRSHVNFDPRNLFSKLLTLDARGFFLVHNHPSGQVVPSASDETLTQQVRLLGRHLSVELIDHCIVSSQKSAWISEL